jgi:hypothetical protein
MSQPTLTAKQQIAFELTKSFIEQGADNPADKAIVCAEKIMKSDSQPIDFVKK